MLAAKAQYSLADAKRYFREHLSVGDYYTEGQHVPGQWDGKGAVDLGLSGATSADEFVRLCENLHPKTGEQLTLRRNTTRAEIDADGIGHQAANRRVFYDFTFSPPKSVSIAALAGGDARIPAVGAEGAITWAEEHLFERRSVINEHELWRHALEYARGGNMRLADIQAVTRQRDYIRNEKYPGKVTSAEHLQRECEIVRMAADGRGICNALAFGCQAGNPRLDAEQRNAVNSLVSSADFVSLFRGGAGTGKSFTLREVQRELQEKGCAVVVVAPQRQQVIGLEQDGLQNVETVSRFLVGRQMPRNAVVLADEAGQIGGKQMHALLSMVKENHGRVILSGDTRQHGAVEATDALRAIEKYSGIEAVELTAIRRQNPALAKSQAERQLIEQYKQAVADARDGNLARSFNRLDKLNVIEPCTLANQHEKIAARYLELAKGNQSCVVVSQSWNEIHKVNDEIRAALKRENRLGNDESVVTAFLPVDLTLAQKRDARSYAPESVLVFNCDARGFKAGEAARLKAITDEHLIVENGSRNAKIPFKQLDKLSVCQSKEMTLCPGDRLQLKANGRSVENKRLANGELVTVKAVGADGQIVLADGRTLDKNYRQFVRGYAVTSYASQGKSVDYVLFSDSAVKAATNNQQWYVTISRGKKGIQILTCDKEGLRENITRSGDRSLAFGPRLKQESRNLVDLRFHVPLECFLPKMHTLTATLHFRFRVKDLPCYQAAHERYHFVLEHPLIWHLAIICSQRRLHLKESNRHYSRH